MIHTSLFFRLNIERSASGKMCIYIKILRCIVETYEIVYTLDPIDFIFLHKNTNRDRVDVENCIFSEEVTRKI